MDQDDTVDFDIGSTPRNYPTEHPALPDSHVQSPIRPVTRACIHSQLNKIPKFLRDTIQTIPVKKDSLLVDSEICYGHILHVATTPVDQYKVTDWVEHHYVEAFNAVVKTMKVVHSSLNLPDPVEKTFIRQQDKFRLSELQKWTDVRVMMQQLRADPPLVKWRKAAHPPLGIDDMILSAYYTLVKISILSTYHWYVFMIKS
jgi:hypothetical protein